MKLVLFPPSRGTHGNVLVLTVVVTAMIGFVLASYLQLIKSQNMANMRSQVWHSTVPVIEAGIEDALAHLNANGATTLIKDGWQSSGNLYWITRQIDPTAYYFVTISNFTGPNCPAPVVESRGYVRMPVQVVISRQTLMASFMPRPDEQGFLARGVRVVAGNDPLFAKGIVAQGKIDMNGNNIETDSFDSADPKYSTDGNYEVTKRKDNGDVATNSGLVNSFNAGNANIRGKVSTGPGGSVSVGSNGSIGDLAWHAAGNSGVQTGWASDDMNVDFRSVSAPFSGGAMLPIPGLVDGTLYDYVVSKGDFQMSSLTLSGTAKMRVTGDAVLYVTGDVSMSGSAQIEIAPGASLKLYVGGASANLGGNGIINQSGTADRFFYYGLPSNTSLSLTGNGEFKGVIYAPQADLTLNGGGTTTTDFIGASITKTATMNGHFNFHYDENLARIGLYRGYSVRTWDEMTPTDVAAYSLSRISTDQEPVLDGSLPRL